MRVRVHAWGLMAERFLAGFEDVGWGPGRFRCTYPPKASFHRGGPSIHHPCRVFFRSSPLCIHPNSQPCAFSRTSPRLSQVISSAENFLLPNPEAQQRPSSNRHKAVALLLDTVQKKENKNQKVRSHVSDDRGPDGGPEWNFNRRSFFDLWM